MDEEIPGFRIPSTLPQDLSFISELIGSDISPSPTAPLPPVIVKSTQSTASPKHENAGDDDMDSDASSEAEVEATLVPTPPEHEEATASTATNVQMLKVESTYVSVPVRQAPAQDIPNSHQDTSSSSSDSSSDSNESDSDEEEEKDSIEAIRSKPREAENENDDDDDDDDGEGGAGASKNAHVQTKNEIPDAPINVPDIEEVPEYEQLEHVGEIMVIINNVVIVRGDVRSSDRVLDTDTLLVFEDRKVFGYIFETFGPTQQPMYQVKFNSVYPLDPEKVQLSRAVFHVPQRSRFVFVSHVKALKGSDASNVHDEEPAEDELEFSDDEAEAAWKSARKQQKRAGSRAGSVASSRQPSPLPSMLHDRDMMEGAALYGTATSRPFDMDLSAGPSRPAPIPYDDPYSDEYNPTMVMDENRDMEEDGQSLMSSATQGYDGPVARSSGRGRDGNRGRSDGNRGRGGGRNAGSRGRGRGRGRGGWGGQHVDATEHPSGLSASAYANATSSAYAPATAYSAGGGPMPSWSGSPPVQQPQAAQGWAYPQQPASYPNQFYPSHQQNQQQAFVQPHINPRFAAAFGMNFPSFPQSHLHQQQPQQHYPSTQSAPSGDWSGQWVLPTTAASSGQQQPQQNQQQQGGNF